MGFNNLKGTLIRVETEIVGVLYFRFLSFQDFTYINDLLDELIEPRDFTLKVLNHQLSEPAIPIEEMSIWDDKLVVFIATEWLKSPIVLNQQISIGQNSYEEFYNAFRNYRTQSKERWDRMAKGLDNIKEIGRVLSKIPKMIPDYSELTEVINKTHQRLENVFQPMGVIFEKYQEQASQFAHSINTISNSLAKAFSSYQFVITDFIARLPDPVEIVEYQREIEKAEQLLKEGGFGFLNHLWTSSYFVGLEDVPEMIRTAVITNQLLSISRSQEFLDELKTEFESCQLVKKRWPVIEMALEAHRLRKYYLSVPALLTQVEGILTDIIILRGEAKLIKGNVYARDMNGNLKKDRSGKPIKLTGLQRKIQHSRFKNNVVLENISALMVSSLIKDRNRIMHGQDFSQVKPKLSLQCLLLILVLTKEINAFLGNNDGTAANTALPLRAAGGVS